ncbi:MAG: PfkB family carbohydrate kinase [bacterium]
MNLLIVGSVAVDSIETPYGRADLVLGGSATYAAIAASYFASPGIVGVVGDDFARKHINLLKKRGIDLDGLQIEPGGKTFHWSGYYEGDMNQAHSRSTCLNVFESFHPRLPDRYRCAPFVLLGNIHPALQLEVLKQMESPRLILCDTMNLWIETEPKLLEQVFRRVDVVCINDGEAGQFCRTSSLPQAADRLLRLGPRRVIIKRGSHGVSIYGHNSFFSLPAVPLAKVKDPTGAGDSFAGGFIGRMARSRILDDNAFRRGLAAGTVMASFCVEDFSCRRTARLDNKNINTRAAALKESVRMPSIRL